MHPIFIAALLGCDAHADPTIDTLFDTFPTCECAPSQDTVNVAYDCRAHAMPSAASLCQRGPSGLHCAPAGEWTQVFAGDVACEPGFCISEDGKSCLVGCGCEA